MTLVHLPLTNTNPMKPPLLGSLFTPPMPLQPLILCEIITTHNNSPLLRQALLYLNPLINITAKLIRTNTKLVHTLRALTLINNNQRIATLPLVELTLVPLRRCTLILVIPPLSPLRSLSRMDLCPLLIRTTSTIAMLSVTNLSALETLATTDTVPLMTMTFQPPQHIPTPGHLPRHTLRTMAMLLHNTLPTLIVSDRHHMITDNTLVVLVRVEGTRPCMDSTVKIYTLNRKIAIIPPKTTELAALIRAMSVVVWPLPLLSGAPPLTFPSLRLSIKILKMFAMGNSSPMVSSKMTI
jgi:hypothetical protein